MTDSSESSAPRSKAKGSSPSPLETDCDCNLSPARLSLLENRRTKLSSRYRKTFKARLEMEKRLIKQQKLLERGITFTSSSMMIVTLLNLYDPTGPFRNVSLVLALLSFITLIGSLLLSAARLPERRIEAFQTYRAVQKLRVEADQLPYRKCPCSWDEALAQIEAEYESLIDSTENHTEADHFRALIADRRANAFETISAAHSNKRGKSVPACREEADLTQIKQVGTYEKIQWYWFRCKDWLANNWPYAIFVIPIALVSISLCPWPH